MIIRAAQVTKNVFDENTNRKSSKLYENAAEFCAPHFIYRPLLLAGLEVCVFADASFEHNQESWSQAGYIINLCGADYNDCIINSAN